MDRDGRAEGGPDPDAPWQVLSSELLIDSRWLRVRRERVRTASGYEIPEYFLLDAPDIVVVLAITEAGQALLVRQYRHGLGRSILELPAGLLEATDRDPAAAVERELLEETGYGPRELEPLGRLAPSPARQSNTTHCFLALGCRPIGPPGGDPTEDIVVQPRPLADLPRLARIGDLASQTSLGCLFLGFERLRERGLLT